MTLAGLKPRVREKSLIIGADIMGRDMDQNHGKHAKGHLLHLRIFIKAPQAAAQRPQGTRDPASLLCTVLGRKLTGLMMPKNGGQPVAHSRHQLNARTRGTTISHYKMAFLQPGAATIARRVGSDTSAVAAHCGGGRGPTGLYLGYAAAATKDPCCTTAATAV